MESRRILVPCLLSLMILIVAAASPLGAATVRWVDQGGGSDGNDGETEATAYASLQHAIDNSTSGTGDADRSFIHVKNGTYETLGLTNSGGFATAILIDTLDYLTIQAVAGHEPVVKPSTAGSIVSISIQNCDGLIIDNIDSDQTTAQFDGWHVNDSDNLTLRNSTFEGGEDGIDFNTSLNVALIENNVFTNITTGSGDEVLDFSDAAASNVTIQDNLFLMNYRHIRTGDSGIPGAVASDMIIRRNTMNGTNSEEAIRLINANGVLVENNIIMNNLQQGIYIDNGSTDVVVRHNTFFNNDQEFGGNGEIRSKVNGPGVFVMDNIIHGNGSNKAIQTATSLAEDYNCVFNTSGDTFGFGPNTTVGLDPKFVSTTPGSEDLHLKYGSAALESGIDLGVTDDNEKNVRPNPAASAPDRGAYEMGVFAIPMAGAWALGALFALLGLFLSGSTFRRRLAR